MQYILTEEEYKELSKLHHRVKMNDALYRATSERALLYIGLNGCPREENEGYCDHCIVSMISITQTGQCAAMKQMEYSK